MLSCLLTWGANRSHGFHGLWAPAPCAGNVRTVDVGGPYDFSQLSTQVNEIMGALSAQSRPTCCAAGRPLVLSL